MNIVLLGIQGSGKGTLVQDLEKHFNFSLVSVGLLLREEIASHSALGDKIKELVDKGLLVDLDIVMNVINKKLSTSKKPIIIFDGFPRNAVKADKLDEICNVDLVIYLNLRKEIAIDRVLNRLTCKDCGDITTLKGNEDFVCKLCGGKLVRRSDDTVEAINTRFEQYEEETYPLIERYRRRGVLVEIDASKTPSEVLDDVMKVIKL